MKATIDIPDDLYQRVAAESARQGRPLDAVVADLIQLSLSEDSGLTRRQRAEQWLANFLRTTDEAFKDAPPGPTAREILEEDRNRLERR